MPTDLALPVVEPIRPEDLQSRALAIRAVSLLLRSVHLDLTVCLPRMPDGSHADEDHQAKEDHQANVHRLMVAQVGSPWVGTLCA